MLDDDDKDDDEADELNAIYTHIYIYLQHIKKERRRKNKIENNKQHLDLNK